MILNAIINGEKHALSYASWERLSTFRFAALQASHNFARDNIEWEVRYENGVLLDAGKPMAKFGFKDQDIVFITLKIGAGGNRQKALS